MMRYQWEIFHHHNGALLQGMKRLEARTAQDAVCDGSLCVFHGSTIVVVCRTGTVLCGQCFGE